LLESVVCINGYRRSGRDCRKPEAMDGRGVARPCILDPGNPCRDDASALRDNALVNLVCQRWPRRYW